MDTEEFYIENKLVTVSFTLKRIFIEILRGRGKSNKIIFINNARCRVLHIDHSKISFQIEFNLAQ